VLVEGRLTPGVMRRAVAVVLGAAGVAAAVLLVRLGARAPGPALLLGALTVLALGYRWPPLRLSRRGLGELTVAVTHSYATVLCGWLVQGGAWRGPFPWLAAAPAWSPRPTPSSSPSCCCATRAGARWSHGSTASWPPP
jgi:1,4-dihydroxy-2-naphthoate octaprenyltransferase